MKIAITFPIFNGLNYTKQCLTNLFADRKIDNLEAEYSVVIVDDNSTDGSWEWIQKNYPQVKLLKGTGDLWWGGGINKAVNYALDELKSDFIIWWNNDIIADENYFSNLYNLLKNTDNRTILGAKIYYAHDKEMVWSMGGIFNSTSGFKVMNAFGEKDCEKFSGPFTCDWLTGMGTVTHRSVYETIGMIDDHNFPQYHGDSDFTLRAKKAGYKIIAHPDLKNIQRHFQHRFKTR
ncbi:MAG: glycosyltransferase family 2 protein [Bacteroidales bacterium]